MLDIKKGAKMTMAEIYQAILDHDPRLEGRVIFEKARQGPEVLEGDGAFTVIGEWPPYIVREVEGGWRVTGVRQGFGDDEELVIVDILDYSLAPLSVPG